jgi:energy-coupling factor transporter ATP-binding protein EcfA2
MSGHCTGSFQRPVDPHRRRTDGRPVDTEIEIMDLFRGLSHEGTTIVMVTHCQDLIPYATHVYRMVRGNLAADQNTPCFITTPDKTRLPDLD